MRHEFDFENNFLCINLSKICIHSLMILRGHNLFKIKTHSVELFSLP